jgi:hypothetical protein
MRLATASLVAAAGLLASPVFAQAPQPTQAAPSMSVPRLVNISGEFRPADGGRPAAFETLTLGIYADEMGGAPLWQETQRVAIDSLGIYTVLLGATEREGVPLHVFGSGEARWLGITWSRAGEAEAPRTRLASVPYALRAADAETLGGLPASAYQLAWGPGVASLPAGVASMPGGRAGTALGMAGTGTDSAGNAVPKGVNIGTTNRIAKYLNELDVGNSALHESGGRLGINTTGPMDVIHSRFTNTTGSITGLAVQNLGSTASSYSGMLFYDQNSSLGLFQGFNNSTHEYRINNVASGGSINFMLGGTSQMKMDPSGRILVGTITPESGTFVKGGLETRRQVVSGQSAIFVRKADSNSFDGAIHARSAVGFTGMLIKGLVGVADNADFGGNVAVLGLNNTTDGIGLRGWGTGTNTVGVLASGTAHAGRFLGDVQVTGTLTKGGGAFQIDHPLDPANKYLLHSFVESPDMMNVYNGNVLLDSQGEATVQLPEWFEALNRDFRYQLTSIGAPANVYVAEKIVAGRFRIAGGAPHGEVSWQVTGIRQDAWANANRIPTEVEKTTTEKGLYLHPSARGQPKEMGLAERDVKATTRRNQKE